MKDAPVAEHDAQNPRNWNPGLYRSLISSFKLQASSFSLQIFILILFIMGTAEPNVHAQPMSGSEYEIKAGFIYNFAKFTRWHRNTPENMVICIVTYNPLMEVVSSLSDKITEHGKEEVLISLRDKIVHDEKKDVFLALKDKIVRGRRIEIRRCYNEENTKGCQILFLCSENKAFVKKMLDSAKGQSILTVGETEGFAQMGGIINFFKEKKKVRFEVNLDAARRSGLHLSAQLLMSAARVIRKE